MLHWIVPEKWDEDISLWRKLYFLKEIYPFHFLYPSRYIIYEVDIEIKIYSSIGGSCSFPKNSESGSLRYSIKSRRAGA